MSHKKNILFLTTNFPPNPSVGTRRVAKILKYMDHSRFNFFVLTLKEEYYNRELGERMGNQDKIPASVKVFRTDKSDLTRIFTFAKQKLGHFLKKRKTNKASPAKKEKKTESAGNGQASGWKAVLIDKLRSFFFAFFEFPDKYIGWLPHAVAQGARIIKHEKIDIILTTAPPHSLFLIALILKKITHKKLVLDFRDPWAISRWDRGNIFRYGMERLVEKLCVQGADQLFFVTPKMRDEYLKLYPGEKKEKFQLFYNGFDPDDFQVEVEEDERDVRGPFRFVHLGTLYKRRNPETLFMAIKNLHEQKQISPGKVRFEFIGSVVSELQFIFKKVKELQIEDYVTFKPPVSFQESIRTMFQADALLLIQPETDLQIPAKMFEYIYIGKPILAIAEENSATHQLLQEANAGILAPSNDIEKIGQAVLTILREETSFKPRAEYVALFNYQKYAKKFERILDGL
ncbi:glycosyl transferase group 1 [Caldithrix abyssi DSM 13497]|uniref:Glycosyl transferase group 1 n=1 Tax=Caldithrix abyssi DSM 13497 TaxID=880073 RepID=H1XXD3_CALAY|nr:glycosyltransferase family 4 protein [Caldithrix abyssi]APF17851.1 Glycosyltransferase involved in cell wall bisynthesis [Caldithrix abyssi DSM 13497]EHO41918.1 glycosyl transferase group 1 [Caldithrix abyssi DSM 13497]